MSGDAATSTCKPAKPNSLPKGTLCFLALFHAVLFGYSENPKHRLKIFSFQKDLQTYLCFTLSTATRFLLRKKKIYCRQTEITARKEAVSNGIKTSHVLWMEYIHFSFSYSFMIVNCLAITVSKNISCLSYIYLFEYWFSCVIEMLRNPSTFFKSYLGTSLFKYHWLFLKVTSLLKIGFRCMMIQKEIENIFILETLYSPTLTHMHVICYQSHLLLIFKRMLQRTERSCVHACLNHINHERLGLKPEAEG